EGLCARIELLSGCARRNQTIALSFSPPSGAWRRTICAGQYSINSSLAQCAAHLTSLTIALALVPAFARAPLALPALRALLLDVSCVCCEWPPAPPTGRVRLPALAQLVFFSVPGEDESVGGESVTVDAAQVVALARALGLRGVRPALVLAGCAFDPQPDARALSRAFYAIDVVDRARDVLPPSSFSAAFDPFSNPWDSIRY
ncbi:hypothetical protein AURDEDRAFT_182644, partial [Auricularia subglabra TFB-10046 SS5]